MEGIAIKTQEEKNENEKLSAQRDALTDAELERVAGGSQPAEIVYRYSVGQLVKIIDERWFARVTSQAGWDRADDCPKYEVEIISVPSSYTGYWQPGKIFVASEDDLQGNNEPPKPPKPSKIYI